MQRWRVKLAQIVYFQMLALPKNLRLLLFRGDATLQPMATKTTQLQTLPPKFRVVPLLLLVLTLVTPPACKPLPPPPPVSTPTGHAQPTLPSLPQAPSPTTNSALPPMPQPGEVGAYRADLTPDQLARAEEGRAEFLREYTAETGLGPHFNDRACANCHNLPVLGGSSDMAHAARIYMTPPDAVHGYERYTLPGYSDLELPEGAPVAMHRPPSLLGIGLFETIPDDVLRAGCDTEDKNHDGIHGRNNRSFDNRPGKFGWKAHTSTIHDFAADAFAGEMGVTNAVQRDPDHVRDLDTLKDPEVDSVLVDRVEAFIKALAPPPRAGNHPPGEKIFMELGCAQCHRPETAPGIFAFSDLCLHDLGPAFDDKIVDIIAQPSEWRSAPLWGLRFRHAYFHDERTRDLAAAILMHGGEAKKVAARFAKLPPEDVRNLLTFLSTL